MPFSEQDSDTNTWRSKSRSVEMLQALGTFSSMDHFMMEGEKYCMDVAFYNLYWKGQSRKTPQLIQEATSSPKRRAPIFDNYNCIPH